MHVMLVSRAHLIHLSQTLLLLFEAQRTGLADALVTSGPGLGKGASISGLEARFNLTGSGDKKQ